MKFSFNFARSHDVKFDFRILGYIEFAGIYKFKTRRGEALVLFQKPSDVIRSPFTDNVVFATASIEFRPDSRCRIVSQLITKHIEMQTVQFAGVCIRLDDYKIVLPEANSHGQMNYGNCKKCDFHNNRKRRTHGTGGAHEPLMINHLLIARPPHVVIMPRRGRRILSLILQFGMLRKSLFS